jgi:hypothetical protein
MMSPRRRRTTAGVASIASHSATNSSKRVTPAASLAAEPQQLTLTNSPRPRSDDTTFDIIDDALAILAERRGVWLGDELAALALVASLIEQAERFLPQLVHDARAADRSWQEIAQALGTSPGEAQLRYDPASPIADNRWPYEP